MPSRWLNSRATFFASESPVASARSAIGMSVDMSSCFMRSRRKSMMYWCIDVQVSILNVFSSRRLDMGTSFSNCSTVSLSA